MAYLVGALIVVASFGLAAGFERDARKRTDASFVTKASAVAMAARSSLLGPLEAVATVPPYFASSGSIEVQEFRTFVRPTLSLHPSIVALGFAPRFLGAEREVLETNARASGFGDFALRERYADGTLGPSRARESYLALLYCEPDCESLRGLDLGALGGVDSADALDAFSSGAVHVVPATQLLSTRSDSKAMAVFAPFDGGASADADPRVPRSGVAFVVVDVERALAPVLAQVPAGSMRLDVVDVSAGAAAAPLYSSATDPIVDDGRSSYEERFRIHDRMFELRFAPLGAPPMSSSALPIVVAVCGTLLGALTTLAILLVMNTRRLRAEVKASRQLGPYHLIRRIGQGGMGTVYEAEHALLRRPTAIKMINDEAATPEALERFEREAKVTSQLTHPNTIVVFDFGRTPKGLFYYAMEFVRGYTIEDVVKTGGAQPAARVVHFLRQIAGSLAEAHAVGLIHRDVKPANVMICQRGGVHDFVKVLDFGLVKDLTTQPLSKHSVVGQTLGTPRYMAPETFVDGEAPTPAADVYAVGAIGWYLLTGRELIEGSSMAAILTHHTVGKVLRPSEAAPAGTEIPPALDELVMRCLSPEKDIRPVDGTALLHAIEALGLPEWTEEDARHARIGHDESYPDGAFDISADDTLSLEPDPSQHRVTQRGTGTR